MLLFYFILEIVMQELNVVEIDKVNGGDGVATVAGIVVGVTAGLLVIGTAGGILAGAALGGAIWGGYSYYLESQ